MNNENGIIRKLSASNLTAQFSEQISLAAIPLVAVITLHASAEKTATLQAIATLPFLILSIPSGIIVGKFNSKKLMVSTEIVRAFALLLMIFLVLQGYLDLYSLSLLSFIVATGTVVYSVATPSLVVATITQENLILTNRGLEIARSTAFTLGPSIAGLLVGYYSGVLPFIVALTLSLASVYFMSGLPKGAANERNHSSILQNLRTGLGLVVSNEYLRPIVITSVIFNTSWFLLLSIFSFYALKDLNYTSSAVGLVLGTYGFGMICGACLYPQLARKISFGKQLILGPLCAFIASLLCVITLVANYQSIMLLAFFLFGFGPIIWTISTTTLRQVITPYSYLSCISSVILTVTFGVRPLGAALGALLSATLSIKSCLIAVFCGFVIQLIVIVVTAPAKVKDLNSLKRCDDN